ncbi:MAG: hydantoinase/oxoprolinase family protein [bacterium]|nr:hydantoinase/oxoprolinase family protein [bacterium]
MAESFVLGIDVGGTFTDVVGLDRGGRPLMFKVPSRPDDPASAVIQGVEAFAAGVGVPVTSMLADAHLVHGTTMGINTLLTRTGAKTGLLTTSGFRDILEIRVGYKEERYELDLEPPVPLVPRRLRLPIIERLDSDGHVVVPLDEEGVLAACEFMVREGVEAVAICFLWSFLDPSHEMRAAELCRRVLPEAFVTTSWDVLPEIREYNRVSTTVLNAYVGPRVVQYVGELTARLEENGFGGTLHFLQSHGGVAHADEVMRVPVRTLMSGPAAGPAVAGFFAGQAGIENAICIDMGGTSFDASVVTAGEVRQSRPVEIDGVRIGLPMVDVHSVGGGGGSIAWVDTGILRVGPSSAGSVPGPASYSLGGTSPTVTDANMVLGIYSPGPIAGGLSLDGEPAGAVIDGLGSEIGVGRIEAADGVWRVLIIDLAQAIRDITVAEGRDPRDYVLVVGGGSGPVHCCAIADELDIDRILIPKAASTLCALGAIVMDVVYELRRSYPMQLSGGFDVEAIDTAFTQLERDLIGMLQGEGTAGDRTKIDRQVGLRYREEEIHVHRGLELRYREQLWEIMVPMASASIDLDTIDEVIGGFHERPHEIYTYSEPENVCELVSLAVRATVPRQLPEIDWDLGAHDSWVRLGERSVRHRDRFMTTPVLDGRRAPVSVPVEGPALIREELCTVFVEPGWTCTLDPYGAYYLKRR